MRITSGMNLTLYYPKQHRKMCIMESKVFQVESFNRYISNRPGPPSRNEPNTRLLDRSIDVVASIVHISSTSFVFMILIRTIVCRSVAKTSENAKKKQRKIINVNKHLLFKYKNRKE